MKVKEERGDIVNPYEYLKWITRYEELRKKLKEINNIVISGLLLEVDKDEILYSIRKITKQVK